MKRVKKLYLNDPSIPVPKRTLFWKTSQAKKAAAEKEERTPLNLSKQDSDFIQDMQEGMTTDQELNSDNSEQDPVSSLIVQESALLVEEPKNICNGGSMLDLENNDILASSDSEGTHSEFSDSQSDTELGTDSSDSSSSESESSSENDSENEEVESESYNNKTDYKFTPLQLQSLAMIAFLLRHNLTGVAVNDLLGLIKVICPGVSELGNIKYDELFQVIDKVNCKTCHYCSICHNVFPLNPDRYFFL